MSLESLKQAVLSEIKNDYEAYNRIEKLFDVAEKAEQDAKEKIEQEEQEKKKVPSISEIARKNRLIK